VFANIMEDGKVQNDLGVQFKSLAQFLREKRISPGRTDWKYEGGLYDGKTTAEARAAVTQKLPDESPRESGGSSGSEDTEQYDNNSPSASPQISPTLPPVAAPNLSAAETSDLEALEICNELGSQFQFGKLVDFGSLAALACNCATPDECARNDNPFSCQSKRPRTVERPQPDYRT
jgi:hypothetical protein